ncbi:PQQ-binding-like beta-propeller repeat protein [Verrucomicrobiota bacterium]
MRKGLFLTGLLIAFVSVALASDTGKEIIKASGVKGGLVVHVGCNNPQLLLDLCANESYLVHALDTDRKNVESARKYIQAKGLYGKVSVDTWDGEKLPYADNLVNLIVMSSAFRVPSSELDRVLAPRGVAMARKGSGLDFTGGDGAESKRPDPEEGLDGWSMFTKPVPSDIDDWTHWLHGPDNNAVAGSKLQEVPRNLQWIQDPLWIRHHNLNPGLSALVSARGRIFYILDEGAPGVRGPDKWFLIARDAFNGVLLWKRPIEEWGAKYWVGSGKLLGRFTNPHQLMRRLVAVEDKVFVTPGIYSAVHVLDAVTGNEIKKYKGTEKTFEIVYHNGVLVLAVNRTLDESDTEPDVVIMAVDAESGDILWESSGYKGIAPKVDSLKRYVDSSLAVGGGQVFLVDQDSVLGLDLKTGAERWRVKRPERPVDSAGGNEKTKFIYEYYYPDLCSIVYSDGVLFFSQILHKEKNFATKNKKDAVLFAIDVSSGKKIWSFDCVTFAHFTPPDIFVVKGLVWSVESDPVSVVGLDPKTGVKKRSIEARDLLGFGGHHNCYRNKATSKFIFTAKKKGNDFIDLDTGKKSEHNWIKGACRYGVMPANGMIYFPAHNCRCYMTTKLNAFFALSSDSKRDLKPSDSTAVEKGLSFAKASEGKPAYGKNPQSAIRNPQSSWSTYRHDNMRSGYLDAELPVELSKKWTAALGGKLTQPVISDGRVFVSSVDEHEVYCLDESTGSVVWSYMAGGRVDSPPTCYKGLVVFGSRDGWIYCLEASKGELVWRFRAAPDDMRISAFSQVESAWPAFGSLIVQDDKVYCSAGRSTHLNTGIYLYVLDVKTGIPLQSKCVLPDFESFGEVDGSVLSDILVGNEKQFHMRGLIFDTENLDSVSGGKWGGNKKKQADRSQDFPSIKAYSGFCDDTWYTGSYWIFNDRPNVGHLLVVGESENTIYGIKGQTGYKVSGSHSESVFKVADSGYQLFANKKSGRAEVKDLSDKQDKKKGGTEDTSTWKNSWNVNIPLRVMAMLADRNNLYLAGVADKTDEQDYWKYLEGRAGGIFAVYSKVDGKKIFQIELDSPPVFDGLSAANGKVFISLKDGNVVCWE